MEAIVDDYCSSITVSYVDYSQPPASNFVGQPSSSVPNESEECLSDLPQDYLDLDEDEPYSSADESDLNRETFCLKHLALGFQVEDFEHQDEREWIENDDGRVGPDAYMARTDCMGMAVIPYRSESGDFIPESSRIMSIVNHFIGNDLYELLTEETNRYYHQQNHPQHTNHNRIKWSDVTLEEMKIFVGLLILMPCVKKCNLAAYWSSDPYHQTPIFSRLMSRDRFFEIWKYWHFNDNRCLGASALLMRDRRCKIAPVLDYFRHKLAQVYQVGREIFLREEIFPWAGRRRFTFRHNPGRVGSLGLVLRTVAECGTGYILNVEFEDIVASLTLHKWDQILTPFRDRHHHLYVDSCYTSVGLARKLLQDKIYLCGPIPRGRGVPLKLIQMEKERLEKGGHAYLRNGRVLLHSYSDRGRTFARMVSTIHKASLKPPRTVSEHRLGRAAKPACLIGYERNSRNGSGHLLETFITDYDFLGSISRFSKRVVLFMLRVALSNSFILYRKLYPAEAHSRHFSDYLWLVAKEMCRSAQSSQSAIVPLLGPSYAETHYLGPVNQVWIHFPVHIKPPEGGKKFPTLRCELCKTVKQRRSETRFCCNFCKLPLHIECFPEFHGLDHPSKATIEEILGKVREKRAKENRITKKVKNCKKKVEHSGKNKPLGTSEDHTGETTEEMDSDEAGLDSNSMTIAAR